MADKPHKILEHGELEAIAPGLWSLTGSLPFPLKRNMAVVRLGDGTLLLHSAIALSPGGMAKLEALGKPSVIVVPNGGHRMDAPFYKQRYPEARVIAPAGARAKVEEVVRVDATAEEALPPLGVRAHALPGYKTGELAYEVDGGAGGGKALIFCDAVANSDHPPGIGGVVMSALAGGIKGRRLGVPRIVKMMQIKDKAAARADLGRLADIPGVTAVLPGHGRPVVDRCAEALREAAATI